jgi:transcriptional regulator with XRE-family HTH domain
MKINITKLFIPEIYLFYFSMLDSKTRLLYASLVKNNQGIKKPLLADRIKTILQEKHFSQRYFAAALGITPAYVNMVCRGKKSSVSIRVARLIQELFGYSETWLLTGKGEKMSDDRKNKNIIRQDLMDCILVLPPSEVDELYKYAVYLKSKRKIMR